MFDYTFLTKEEQIMSIRVLVNGAKGKMGTEVVVAVREQRDMELVCQSDVGDNLVELLKKTNPDVVVDFTHPDCACENARKILEAKTAGVIGTTGFAQEELEELDRLAKENGVGLLIAPNFCIGAVLMMRFAEEAAQFMPDAEIVELHHPAKADAPSGTAALTARIIAQHSANTEVKKTAVATEVATPFRGGEVEGVRVHSVRLPGLVAHQEVIFGGEAQVLTIRHDSMNRTSFMPGVMKGIREVRSWTGLVHGLDKVLFQGETGIETGV